MQTWKPVPIDEYSSLYEVSSDGQIRSLCNRYKNKSDILKQCIGSRGYYLVTLCNGKRQTTFNVHRLVALAFIPNPDSLPCVNHKDQNRLNNNVSNLEWVTYYQNNVYGDRLEKSGAKRGNPVRCIETNEIYRSGNHAAVCTGLSQPAIWACCNGKQKTVGGYHWEYLSPPYTKRIAESPARNPNCRRGNRP